MRKVNFNFLNFCTIYRSKGSNDHKLKREYCFSQIFYQGPNTQKNEYALEIYIDKAVDNDDNNCFLTKEELEEHINTIKKIKKFEHTIEELPNKYVIHFTLDAPRVYHKIILSWLRYTYEFPFNMALYETFKLKKIPGFKRVNTFNLFNLIAGSMNYTKHGCNIHAIGEFDRFKKLINWKDFNKKITQYYKRDPKCEINSLVDYAHLKDNEVKYIKKNPNLKINNSEFWETENEFKNRVKVYRHNLRILKNIK